MITSKTHTTDREVLLHSAVSTMIVLTWWRRHAPAGQALRSGQNSLSSAFAGWFVRLLGAQASPYPPDRATREPSALKPN